MRVRVRLTDRTAADRALFERVTAVPGARRPEYLRRLMTAGMRATYGPALDGVMPPGDWEATADSEEPGAYVFCTRMRIEGIDSIEVALIRCLQTVFEARKQDYIRRLLLAGSEAFYGSSDAFADGSTANAGAIDGCNNDVTIKGQSSGARTTPSQAGSGSATPPSSRNTHTITPDSPGEVSRPKEATNESALVAARKVASAATRAPMPSGVLGLMGG